MAAGACCRGVMGAARLPRWPAHDAAGTRPSGDWGPAAQSTFFLVAAGRRLPAKSYAVVGARPTSACTRRFCRKVCRDPGHLPACSPKSAGEPSVQRSRHRGDNRAPDRAAAAARWRLKRVGVQDKTSAGPKSGLNFKGEQGVLSAQFVDDLGETPPSSVTLRQSSRPVKVVPGYS